MSRPSWDEYFLNIASVVSSRATCLRKSVGCVLVDSDNRIISTGYNGSAPGETDCIESGCLLIEDRCERTIHAEQNALLYARSKAFICYTTLEPCHRCALLLKGAGITKIVFLESMADFKAGRIK